MTTVVNLYYVDDTGTGHMTTVQTTKPSHHNVTLGFTHPNVEATPDSNVKRRLIVPLGRIAKL